MMREDIHCMLSYLFNQMTRINVRYVSYACACAKQHIGNCIVDQHFHEKKNRLADCIADSADFFWWKKKGKKKERRRRRDMWPVSAH